MGNQATKKQQRGFRDAPKSVLSPRKSKIFQSSPNEYKPSNVTNLPITPFPNEVKSLNVSKSASPEPTARNASITPFPNDCNSSITPFSHNNNNNNDDDTPFAMKTNEFLDDILDELRNDNKDNNQEELRHKIVAYNTNDFNSMFDEVSTEIDNDYNDKNDIQKINKNKNKNKNKNNNLYVQHVKEKKKRKNSDHVYVQHVKSMKLMYSYKKQLGEGATCRVVLAENRIDKSQKYALKELSKHDRCNEELFAKEIQLLQKLKSHPNVVDYYDSYQTKYYYYLATVYCSGGTFLDRIIELKKFNERDAVYWIKIILSAVDYMHDLNIVHRDLKLNNMVFSESGAKGVLKIIDFGHSDIVSDNKSYNESVGTLVYLSPECKRTRKGWEVKKSDMWSIGCICYILLTGKLPFDGTNKRETFKLIEKGVYKWPIDLDLSDECKSFVSALLRKSTRQRLSAKQALHHEWIINEEKQNKNDILQKTKEFLMNFNYNNKLHKILVNAILEEIDNEEHDVLINSLHNLDVESNGLIDESDIVEYLLRNSNMSHMNTIRATKQAKYIMKVVGDKIDKQQSLETEPNFHKSKSIPIEAIRKELSNSPKKRPSSSHQQIKFTIKQGDKSDNDDNKQEHGLHLVDEENEDDDDDKKLSEISVYAFRNIMAKSPKLYPVDNLVKELDPKKTGFISFETISKFSKAINTVSFDVYCSDAEN